MALTPIYALSAIKPSVFVALMADFDYICIYETHSHHKNTGFLV